MSVRFCSIRSNVCVQCIYDCFFVIISLVVYGCKYISSSCVYQAKKKYIYIFDMLPIQSEWNTNYTQKKECQSIRKECAYMPRKQQEIFCKASGIALCHYIKYIQNGISTFCIAISERLIQQLKVSSVQRQYNHIYCLNRHLILI